MRGKEWSLVIFTLLVPMAVGLFLMHTTFHFLTNESTTSYVTNDLSSVTFLIVDLLLIMGVVAATFHLGQPINARLAMSNLKKSWLSREMLLGLSFGLVMLLLSLLSWLEIDSPIVSTLLLIIGSVVGIVLLYAISRIYMLRTVPTWNTLVIPLSLLSSTFLLGSILFGDIIAFLLPSLHSASDLSQEIEGLLPWIEYSPLGLMFVQVLLSYILLKGSQTQIHPMDSSSGGLWLKQRLIFMLRLGLGLIGIALNTNFMDQFIGNFHSEGPWAYLLFTSFLLVLLSETFGRILFYASYKSAGI
jgi:anaerobic dimethyl sulfoxide reductase subunit C (anchor subunit)